MRRRHLVLTTIILLLAPALPLAGDRTIPRNATIYIEELPEDLHVYLKAEFIKKKIPLVVVSSPEDADLLLSGTAQGTEKKSWHEGWLTPRPDKFTGALEILDREGVLLWAGEAGDRSLWFGAFKRGGSRKVAGRLAQKIKKAVKKK